MYHKQVSIKWSKWRQDSTWCAIAECHFHQKGHFYYKTAVGHAMLYGAQCKAMQKWQEAKSAHGWDVYTKMDSRSYSLQQKIELGING